MGWDIMELEEVSICFFKTLLSLGTLVFKQWLFIVEIDDDNIEHQPEIRINDQCELFH